MLRVIDTENPQIQSDSVYPFGVFRLPSFGILAAPPEVPVSIWGLQLLYSMANDVPFLDWGSPGGAYQSAVIDFTHSDYALSKISQTLEKLVLRDTNLGKVVAPRLYSVSQDGKGRWDEEEIRNLVETLERLAREGVRCFFLNGISGYFDEHFYACLSALKRLTVSTNACIIITHVIASVIYGDGDEQSFRAPLSHKMIRASHLEAISLADWTWYVAPTTESIIRKVTQRTVKQVPPGAYLYVNKIIQPNKIVAVSSSGLPGSKPQEKGLFYLYKATAPYLMCLELGSTA